MLKEEARAFAYQVGLELVGITTSQPFLNLLPFLKKRQAQGLDTPWEEKDLLRRLIPTSFFPEAKTLLVFALPYQVLPPSLEEIPPLRGQISRAAWGRDYHFVLHQKLQELGTSLLQAGKIQKFVVCVDTGPLVEKEVAFRAGLGFYGKNCLLFVPPYGSWVFLGELLVDTFMEPDSSLPTRCPETCTTCLKACPSGALLGPYRLNPLRCIAYLTQASGFLPAQERELLANHLYGCDLCQEVCPQNKNAFLAPFREFSPSSFQQAPDLTLCLGLSNRVFRAIFGDSALAWRGAGVLARNAAVALGNSGNPQAVPFLAQALRENPRPVVRGHAAWALGKLGEKKALLALEKAFRQEPHPLVKKEIELALRRGANLSL